MHLFGFSGLGERYAEADTILAGNDVPKLSVDDVPLAAGSATICAFLSFSAPSSRLMFCCCRPRLPTLLARRIGELLLRARAVENQCYVIASAQGGLHESGRRTFGHSMIIDPWGDVLATLPEGEGVICADLDTARLQSVRTRLPALKHRLL